MNRLILKKKIEKKYSGKRIDHVLCDLFPKYSRSILKKWLVSNKIKVSGKQMRPSDKICGDETLSFDIKIANETDDYLPNKDINIETIYDDDHIIVINKSINLIVHPGNGNHFTTLLNGLLYKYPELSKVPRAGIIHRLDKDTSGIMVVARNNYSYNYLFMELKKRNVLRKYIAIISGSPISGGTITLPIGRDLKAKTRLAVLPSGKPAVTHYKIIRKYKNFSIVDIRLETGRTHQIRVHMSFIKHPIIGDQTYGVRNVSKNTGTFLNYYLQQFKHQALHAYKLCFNHPKNTQSVCWTAKLPSNFTKLLLLLEKDKIINNNKLDLNLSYISALYKN